MDKELQKKLLELFDEEELEMAQEGEWEQDHKYQFKSSVAKYEDKFYQFSESRSGSYHTDWYYNDTDVQEVTPVKKVIEVTEYVIVK